MAVLQNYVSVFFRKLLSLTGLSAEKLRVFKSVYWRCKLFGIKSLTKDPLKGLDVLRNSIRKKNNRKFALYRCVEIGDFTDMSGASVLNHDFETKLVAGKYCSVSWGVTFFLGQEHATGNNTTYMFHKNVRAYSDIGVNETKGGITIGNDVWIASDVKVLSGVNIGDGAVIGANSLVTKDVPKYAIYGGNPAKLIRMRFSEDIIKIFGEIKWWDWPLEDINRVIPVLQSADAAALKKYYDANITNRKNGA
jgi:acetyltransferase-like isoleucine patch superfamily enzyme